MARTMTRRMTGSVLDNLQQVLSDSWSKRTSYDPAGWSNRNPAWGQCAVTALIIQDLFGGIVLRGLVNGIEHYWNRLPNKAEVDLTRTQFSEVREIASVVPVSRKFILSAPSTASRYAALKRRVFKKVAPLQASIENRL